MPARRSSRGCGASACSRHEAPPPLDFQRRLAEAVPDAGEIRELMLEPAQQTMVQHEARGGKGSR